MQEKLCSGTAVARMAVVRGRDTVPVEPIAILGPVFFFFFGFHYSAPWGA